MMMSSHNYTEQWAVLLLLVEWGGWRGGRGWYRTVCWKNQSYFMEALCGLQQHTWIWTAWLPLRWCDKCPLHSWIRDTWSSVVSLHDKGGIQKTAIVPVCCATGLWSGSGIFQCLCWIMLLQLIRWTGSVRLTDWNNVHVSHFSCFGTNGALTCW